MSRTTPLNKSEILEVVERIRATLKPQVDCKAMTGVPTSEMIVTFSKLKDKATLEVMNGGYKATVKNAARRHLGKSPVILDFIGGSAEISISVVVGVSSSDLQAFLEQVAEPLNY
ncbi:hypothetical protein [Bdellovibrio sp. BCCA]|uniref:hypothetical protein n=1 Tax=Bdellovibrio sp. BCCA TaxID=3136281 RepID=UPI0030F0C41C